MPAEHDGVSHNARGVPEEFRGDGGEDCRQAHPTQGDADVIQLLSLTDKEGSTELINKRRDYEHKCSSYCKCIN